MVDHLQTHYKHIIWDWNGTLLDDAWLCVDIMNSMLQERSLGTLDIDRYQRLFDFPVIDYYRRLGFDFSKESFEKSGTEFIKRYEMRQNELVLNEGVKDTLEKINLLGLSQSILSASSDVILQELTTRLGLRHYFVKVIGLDDHYAFGKIEKGKAWMKELKKNPDEVLLIGDTSHDFEVSKELNIDCILIPSGHYSKEKLLDLDVPLISSISQVLDFI
ncbi:MAG: hypothetical protein CMG75_09270 [Candidatus Marinimicrobia bacterium]|nr:hypothetical protein [Candidatus Neomarinimicrobiota bacterium]|tara:strand:+ start:27627 stop:28280 length:654 start_codon:yes stop_codon:yes gene_type:complete